MKYFVHYKNKPYKYVGLANHSETLEDMVIYETRYENPNGRVWVRPKKMFFESVIINSEPTPRFRKVPLEIEVKISVKEADLEIIAAIMKECFGNWDPTRFHLTFEKFKTFHLLIARIEGKPVGFKIGYEKDKDEFYSWLGGVLPEYQGLGIAVDLMTSQHDWCRQQGYTKISTKTQNQFKTMLLLNIENGFKVVGTESTDKGEVKILMEKKL